jgi:hypothetical protein
LIWCDDQKQAGNYAQPSVNSKLDLYDEQFELEKFKEGIDMMKKNWKRDLQYLLPNVPSFDDVVKKVLTKIADVMT